MWSEAAEPKDPCGSLWTEGRAPSGGRASRWSGLSTIWLKGPLCTPGTLVRSDMCAPWAGCQHTTLLTRWRQPPGISAQPGVCVDTRGTAGGGGAPSGSGRPAAGRPGRRPPCGPGGRRAPRTSASSRAADAKSTAAIASSSAWSALRAPGMHRAPVYGPRCRCSPSPRGCASSAARRPTAATSSPPRRLPTPGAGRRARRRSPGLVDLGLQLIAVPGFCLGHAIFGDLGSLGEVIEHVRRGHSELLFGQRIRPPSLHPPRSTVNASRGRMSAPGEMGRQGAAAAPPAMAR